MSMRWAVWKYEYAVWKYERMKLVWTWITFTMPAVEIRFYGFPRHDNTNNQFTMAVVLYCTVVNISIAPNSLWWRPLSCSLLNGVIWPIFDHWRQMNILETMRYRSSREEDRVNHGDFAPWWIALHHDINNNNQRFQHIPSKGAWNP